MRFIINKLMRICAVLVFCSIFKPVFSGALIHASVTGRVWAVNRYRGRIVRFTIRDDGWPNALHDIVIQPSTHIYPAGAPRRRLSPNALYRGEHVRAQGGVTTFGDRIVADRVILLVFPTARKR